MALSFDTNFSPAYGAPVPVAQNVVRLTVNNPGPFTFYGTNSYVVGHETLAVVDPGPDDEAHLAALHEAIDGRPVSHIFVTHTHKDHSPLAKKLSAATGACVVAEGPHRPARALRIGEINPLDASGDTEFAPDLTVGDDELITSDGWAIRAIMTPGHTANHVAFALEGTGVLFSGDHVMAWSTSIVAPPDGSMKDYMASLDRLSGRNDTLYLPGHGGPVRNPLPFVDGLRAHRLARERAVIDRLSAGDRTIATMVAAIYRDVDPNLHGAAALSVLAQIEYLVAKGQVIAEGEISIDGIFHPS